MNDFSVQKHEKWRQYNENVRFLMILLLMLWCPETRKMTTVPEERFSEFGGGAGKLWFYVTDPFRDRRFGRRGPGERFWRSQVGGLKVELWQRCEWADLHEVLRLPREKATPHIGLARRDEIQESEKSRQYNENGRFWRFCCCYGGVQEHEKSRQYNENGRFLKILLLMLLPPDERF